MQFSARSRSAWPPIRPKRSPSTRSFCIKSPKTASSSRSGVSTPSCRRTFLVVNINYQLSISLRQLWTWSRAWSTKVRPRVSRPTQRWPWPTPTWWTLRWARPIRRWRSWRESWRSPATLCWRRSWCRCSRRRRNSRRCIICAIFDEADSSVSSLSFNVNWYVHGDCGKMVINWLHLQCTWNVMILQIYYILKYIMYANPGVAAACDIERLMDSDDGWCA